MEGKEHTDTHSSHHHLHSRFLKSSHISVTIATLLSPSLFHSCFFSLFFFLKEKKIHHSLSYSLSLVNITETPRPALHLLVQRGEGGRGAAHVSEGGGCVEKTPGRGQYQEGPGDGPVKLREGGMEAAPLMRDQRP